MMLPMSAFYFSAVRFADATYRRKLKVLWKLQLTEIGLCKLFVKNSLLLINWLPYICIRAMTTLFI